MALSYQKIAVIKAEYEAGKSSKVAIAEKHGIHRDTLRKVAVKNKWEYAKNSEEISEIVEQKSLEQLIEKEIDKATKLTNQFLSDSSEYRDLIMGIANELKGAFDKAKEEAEKSGESAGVPKEEFDRIFAGSKIPKINLEALNIAYSGARKALGMDREDKLKEGLVETALPEDLSTPGKIKEASEAVIKEVSSGKMTPSEGAAMVSLLDSHRKTLETVDLEKRIEELEDRAE